MANELLKNRIKQTCQGSGTGDLDILSGAAITGFKKVEDSYQIGESGIFVLESGVDWEIFYGTRTSASILSRQTVIESTNSNNKLVLDGGITHVVYCDLNSAGYVYIDSSGVAKPGKAILTASTVNNLTDLTSAGAGFGGAQTGVMYLVLGNAAQDDGGGGFYRWDGAAWQRVHLRKLLKIGTAAGGDPTPDVANIDAVITTNSTPITNFINGSVGQVIYVIRGNADIQLVDSASLDLGGQDVTLTTAVPSVQLLRCTEGSLTLWKITGGAGLGGGQSIEDTSNTGNGVTLLYSIAGGAGTAIGNTQVYVSGLRQRPTTDYTVADNGANLDVTFATAPPNGAPIHFIIKTNTNFSATAVSASNVTYAAGSVQGRLDTDLLYRKYTPQSTEPAGAVEGFVAYSDGTASTNKFGSYGAGLYAMGASVWYPLDTKKIYGQTTKTHWIVEDRDLLTPPGGPTTGQAYLMPASGTLLNAWSTYSNNDVAVWDVSGWIRIQPTEGFTVDVKDEDIGLRYNGTTWRTIGSQKAYQTVGDGSNTIDVAGAVSTTGYLVFINGAPILPSQITSITQNTPAQGQTRIVFTFTVAAVDNVLIFG